MLDTGEQETATEVPSAPGPGMTTAMWVVLNLPGWVLGITAGLLLTLIAQAVSGLDPDRALVWFTLLGVALVIGVVQSLVMGRIVGSRGRWIVATLIGYALAGLIVLVASAAQFPGTGLVPGALLLVAAGACVGLAQWPLLRSRFEAAWIWIAASALSLVPFVLLIARPVGSPLEFVMLGSALGALGSVFTGLALARLLPGIKR